METPVARWYVLVFIDDSNPGGYSRPRTRREMVRAYNSKDAATRFRPRCWGRDAEGKTIANQYMDDVEPYEPDLRADHRNIQRHRGDRLDSDLEVR